MKPKHIFIYTLLLVCVIIACVAGAGCTGTDDGSVVYRTELTGDNGLVEKYLEISVNDNTGYVLVRLLDAFMNVEHEAQCQIDHGQYNNPAHIELGELGSANYVDEIMLLNFNGKTFRLYPV